MIVASRQSNPSNKQPMNKVRDREVLISYEKWFIGACKHFMERIKQRCGNEVSIDDAISGLLNGYIISEKRNASYSDFRNSIKVLCKIPFAKSNNPKLKEPYYIIVAAIEPFRRMLLATIYEAWFDQILPNRIKMSTTNEKQLLQLSGLTTVTKESMVMP